MLLIVILILLPEPMEMIKMIINFREEVNLKNWVQMVDGRYDGEKWNE